MLPPLCTWLRRGAVVVGVNKVWEAIEFLGYVSVSVLDTRRFRSWWAFLREESSGQRKSPQECCRNLRECGFGACVSHDARVVPTRGRMIRRSIDSPVELLIIRPAELIARDCLRIGLLGGECGVREGGWDRSSGACHGLHAMDRQPSPCTAQGGVGKPRSVEREPPQSVRRESLFRLEVSLTPKKCGGLSHAAHTPTTPMQSMERGATLKPPQPLCNSVRRGRY